MYLEQLSNACGVSSAEAEVRKIIVEAARPYADELRVDTIGNLFVTRHSRIRAKGSPLKVMVTAHMDEVGFMISKINPDGKLKFKPVGGFDRRVLLGKSVIIGRQKVPGVIGLTPVHLAPRGERRKVGSIDSMYIDIGASEKTANGQVKVGDLATFAPSFAYLGGQKRHRTDRGLVKGKAFDDRAGCAVLLELLKGDYPVDLLAIFTVQEEIGLRGARVAAYAANPDLAFILECTAADDLPAPDDEPADGYPRMGDGPAITVMDRTFIANRQLVDLLTDTANREDIPHQFKRPGIGGTDAGAVHVTRAGVPSAAVSLAARYIHSPAAILDLVDFWRMVRLMEATLQRLPEGYQK